MKIKLQFSACETQVKTWAEGNDDHEAEVEKPENSSACLFSKWQQNLHWLSDTLPKTQT